MAELNNQETADHPKVDTAVSSEIYKFFREQLKGADRRKAATDSGRFTGILSRRKLKHKIETLLELTGKDTQFQSLIGNAMVKGSRMPGRSVDELLTHGYNIGLPPFSIHKLASDFKVNPMLIKRIFFDQGRCIKLSEVGWVVFDNINELIHFSRVDIEDKGDNPDNESST